MKNLSVLFLMLVTSCGESTESGAEAALGASVEDLSQVNGTWVLDEVKLMINEDQAVVSEGVYRSRVMANSTYVNEIIGFSLSLGGISVYTNCSGYSNGFIDLLGESIVSSEIYFAKLGGNCGDEINTLVNSIDPTSSNYYISGETLTRSDEFTYQDEDGNSKQDALLWIFKKTSEETWDGSGIDDKSVGRWKLNASNPAKINCASGSNGEFEITHSGDLEFEIKSDSSYSRVLSGFKIGDDDACTGTDQGTVTQSRLDVTINQTSFDTPCIETPEDSSVVVGLDRDMVIGNKLISILSYTVDDDSCTSGKNRLETVDIYTRQ